MQTVTQVMENTSPDVSTLIWKVTISGRTAMESVELRIITTIEITCHSVVSIIKANLSRLVKPTAVEIMKHALTTRKWKMIAAIGKFIIYYRFKISYV